MTNLSEPLREGAEKEGSLQPDLKYKYIYLT